MENFELKINRIVAKIKKQNLEIFMKLRDLLLVITLFFSFFVHASELQEDAFHAISSLCFHIEEMKEKNETITFAEEDIATLWETAFCHPIFCNYVDEAYRSYYQNPLQLEETENLLKNVWEEMQIDLYKAVSKKKKTTYPNFDDNFHLTNEMRNQMRRYLLPLSHPLKKSVDALFSQSRVTTDKETLERAGFNWICTTVATFLEIVKHPTVPGYLFKIHLDSEPHTKNKIPPWKWLVFRCEGAEKIRNIIQKKNMKYFAVPNKWLYPLPIKPSPLIKESQPVVLMVTDMNIVSVEETELAWRTKVTKAHLNELYTILCGGYGSTMLDANIPYTKSGKFAFIDTEYPKRKLNFATVRRFLSDEMREYWDSLVRSGGKR